MRRQGMLFDAIFAVIQSRFTSMILMRYAFLLFSLWFGHPLHVSITSIEVDGAKGEVSVSHKFFTDDFSLLFYHLYEKNIMPEEGSAFSDAELQTIEQYMAHAFFMQQDGGDTIDLAYAGKEQNEDSVWLYFKGKLPEDFTGNLSVTNRIMLDLYEDQTNLVIMASEGKEQGLTFDYRNRQLTVSIN